MRSFIVKTIDGSMKRDTKSINQLFIHSFFSLLVYTLIGYWFSNLNFNYINEQIVNCLTVLSPHSAKILLVLGLFFKFTCINDLLMNGKFTRPSIIFIAIIFLPVVLPVIMLAYYLWGLYSNTSVFTAFILLHTIKDKNSIKIELNEHLLLKKQTPIKETITDDYKGTHNEYPSYSELENWVETKISKQQSIKKLFYRYSDKKLEGYDYCMVYWSQYIPLELLDDSSKLELLKTNKIPPLFDKIPLPINISILYKNYNQKQILNLFRSSFDGMSYSRKILKYIKKYRNTELPVFKKMNELMEYLGALEYSNSNFEFKLPKHDLSDFDPRFLRIKNAGELFKYAEEFSNCAKSYIQDVDKLSLTFYIIKKDNPIIFHVDSNLKVKEAKYKLNKDVNKDDFDLIQNILIPLSK